MNRFCCLFLALALPLAAAVDLTEARKLMESKRTPEAIPLLEQAIAAEPQNVDALLLLGQCYLSTQKLDHALSVLEKAVALQPKRADVLCNYGIACMNGAEKQRSISLVRKGKASLEEAVALEPANQLAREALIGFYSNAPFIVGGSMSKAVEHAEAIRALNPERGLVLLVGLKLKDKDYDEAFALVEQALKSSPDNYTYLYEMGRIASTSGRKTAAGEAALQKCLTLPPPQKAPGHAGVHYRLGLLFKAQGQADKARIEWEAGLKLEPGNKVLVDALGKLAPRAAL